MKVSIYINIYVYIYIYIYIYICIYIYIATLNRQSFHKQKYSAQRHTISHCVSSARSTQRHSTPPHNIRPSVCLSVGLSVRPSVRLSVLPSVRPSDCLSFRPSVRLSVPPSVVHNILHSFSVTNQQRLTSINSTRRFG